MYFKVGQAGIIDRLLSYFGTDDYRDLRQYLITNFRSALSECNHRGELGLIRMTRAALFDLIQADFIICIKNLSDLMLADANYPQFYHFEPKLVEEPTNCCVISDQWKLHCFHVLDVNRIWHSSVLQLVLPLSIMTRSAYPIEYLCCFQEGIQGIIWAKTQCVYKDTLHQIIKNCRCPFSAQQLPAVIILWHEAGYEIDRTIENIRPIDLCLSFGLIESAELLIYLGVNPAGTSAVKYLVHFSKPIQIKILNQMSGKPNYVLHEILKKCSNQMIDEKLMDTIQLLGTYNYPLDEKIRGVTPLSICLKKNYKQSAGVLVKLGASIYTIVNQHCYLGNFYKEYDWMKELDKLESLDVCFGEEKLLDLLLRCCPAKAFELIRKHGYASSWFFMKNFSSFPDICLSMLPSIKDDIVLTEYCYKMVHRFSLERLSLDLFRRILSLTSQQVNQRTNGWLPIDIILSRKTKHKHYLVLALLPYHPLDRPLIKPKNIGDNFVRDTIEVYFTNRLFWSPETHKYFPPVFHSAVFHLCLVTSRFKDQYYRVPKVILYHIIVWLEKAYLPS